MHILLRLAYVLTARSMHSMVVDRTLKVCDAHAAFSMLSEPVTDMTMPQKLTTSWFQRGESQRYDAHLADVSFYWSSSRVQSSWEHRSEGRCHCRTSSSCPDRTTSHSRRPASLPHTVQQCRHSRHFEYQIQLRTNMSVVTVIKVSLATVEMADLAEMRICNENCKYVLASQKLSHDNIVNMVGWKCC